MGLIIKPTEEKKITIQGTSIEVPEVYARLEFTGRASGTTIEASVATFASKEAFKSGASIFSTTVEMGNINQPLEEGETQSLETAHKYVKLAYEQRGFEVISDLTI